jgi:oxalate decarboxylase/phosphoglucose isomerase-like protein (cupin superfamily)
LGDTPRYAKISEAEVAETGARVYGGDGTISRRYFRFDGAPAPANFVIYDMPPGSSEGAHIHTLGDTIQGAFDEYYYVISGAGEMEIEDEIIPIRTGDHVHTPLGVRHGVRNTLTDETLRIFLTFISRTTT